MKIYMDITQLVNWQGNLTGIPRVINELANRFIAGDSETEFVLVKWHSNEQRFVEAEMAHSTLRPAVIENDAVSNNALKKVARKLYNTSPHQVQSLARSCYSKYNQTSKTENQDLSQYSFEPSSKILIAWGEWGDIAYQNKLVELSQQEIELYQIVYDMLPIVTPQFSGHSTEWLTGYAAKVYPVCTKLISISEHTKKDVEGWLINNKLTVPNISVIRLGEDFEITKSIKPSHNFFSLTKEYLLVVGTIEIRKNHQLLYYVYKRAITLGHTLPKIVIVGRKGWMTEQTYELMTKDPEVKDSFVFLHDASDDELSWIYDNCMFTVYPSFYEGWGLPVAESTVRAVPCLASNTSSIPEVAGDLANYFDPYSVDDCLNQIIKLLDKDQRAIVKARLNAYRPTSWAETFLQVKIQMGL